MALLRANVSVQYRSIGPYAIVHTPTGQGYVGSSGYCILRRLATHLWSLRHNKHSSPKLQELWNLSKENDWELVILGLQENEELKDAENRYIKEFAHRALNNHKDSRGYGHQVPEYVREKQRKSRAKYLETPGAREQLSKKAKRQHEEKNLGSHTWKEGARERISEMAKEVGNRPENKKRLQDHIASQSSEEMSRRSRMRKIFQK